VATSSALVAATIRNQVFLERLKAGDVRKFAPFLRRIDTHLREVLTRWDLTGFQRERVAAMLAEIEALLAGVFDAHRAQLQGDLFAVADYQAGFEGHSLQQAVHGFTPNIPGAFQLRAAVLADPLSVRGVGGGKLLEPFLKDWARSEIEAVSGTIRRGFAEGQTTAQVIQAIRGTRAARYADGLLAVTERHAEAVVRTSVQHVASVARMETWKANADLVTGYRWVSTLDSRTTEICQSLDGRVFKLGQGPTPPAHINCRSTTAAELDPAFDFLKAGAERASADGPVPASETYYDWLKGQPTAFQDAVLGPSRGALFRDGGLSAERFGALQLDRNFQPMTLAEMKDLEPLAFKRAGLD
jgi:SPP1 gp7 family putative phage head morphogenesis protein